MDIRKAREEDIPRLCDILKAVVRHMHETGFDQWDEHYPTKAIIQRDIAEGICYIYHTGEQIAGFVMLDQNQPDEYAAIDFQFGTPYLCVHRLAIDPLYHRQGIAKAMMCFAESYAKSLGCTAIRLDTRHDNIGALKLYDSLGYIHRGHVHFPRAMEHEFPCMEKKL